MNRLGKERSPYLLQHKDNPVDWYPWGEEAFAAARREEKPIFLSIGYSTCYWCHVMEHDSFEHDDVAAALRRACIAVKVDREERPDVDQIYMDAVVGFTGHGGWPMSVFLTPDLKPFWGGTFFYREQFLKIVTALSDAWERDRKRVLLAGEEVAAALRERIQPRGGGVPWATLIEEIKSQYRSEYDSANGGFGGAPKFPPSLQLRLLLQIGGHDPRSVEFQMVVKTLEQMARGGIYDQIGGGFHRYAVDAEWKIPHFEKMLYDNALLALAYLEGYQVSSRALFAEVARETLQYVLREMQDSSGGFYSAQDAGAVGQEGEYYVHRLSELEALLPPEQTSLAQTLYGVKEGGNFEHGNTVLALANSIDDGRRESQEAHALREALLNIRRARARPHLDTKILTSWNGLMITALARGYRVLGAREFLEAAERCAAFLHSSMWNGHSLRRRFCAGEVGIPALLDDFANLIEGLLALYECEGKSTYLNWAFDLQHRQDDLFWDQDEGAYFYSTAPEILVRRKDILDNATPAANGTTFSNLVRLHALFPEARFRERLLRMQQFYAERIGAHPRAYPRAAAAYLLAARGAQEVVVCVPEGSVIEPALAELLHREYLPRMVLAQMFGAREGSSEGGQHVAGAPAILAGREALGGRTTIYVCHEGRCERPVFAATEAREILTSAS